MLKRIFTSKKFSGLILSFGLFSFAAPVLAKGNVKTVATVSKKENLDKTYKAIGKIQYDEILKSAKLVQQYLANDLAKDKDFQGFLTKYVKKDKIFNELTKHMQNETDVNKITSKVKELYKRLFGIMANHLKEFLKVLKKVINKKIDVLSKKENKSESDKKQLANLKKIIGSVELGLKNKELRDNARKILTNVDLFKVVEKLNSSAAKVK